MRSVCVAVLLLSALSLAVADQPQGVIAFVDVGSQLDALFNAHIPQWIALLQQISLSDVHTSGSGFDIDLTNLHLSNFALGKITTSGSASGVFSFTVSGVGAELDLNFHARESSWPHISDSGSARATFSDGTLSGQVVLSVAQGSLQVAVPSVSCNLNNFNLDIHSSLSFLYDLLKGLVEDSIKDSVQDALRDEIRGVIPQYANPYLASIPKTVPLHIGYQNITIASLVLDTSAAAVTGDAESLKVAATGSPVELTTQCPYPASHVPHATLSMGSLATVAVDEALLNCFAWDVYNQGHLEYLLTAENLHETVLPLNTSAWASYVPALAKLYPNLPMQVLARASDVPSVTISAGPTVNVSLPTALAFSVVNGSDVIPVFTLSANFTGSANALQAHVERQFYINITAAVATGGCSVGVLASEIGPFDASSLAGLFDFGTKIGLTYVNQILSDGWTVKVPLPPPLIMTVAGVDADEGYLRVYAATAPPVYLE